MKISEEALDEFIAICKDTYGITYEREEARSKASQFLRLYELIYRPLPEEIEAHRRELERQAHRSPPAPEAS